MVVIRAGRWFNDGVLLAATLAVAASPLGGWLAGWWLAVPLLYSYNGALLVAVSLAAWFLRARRPGSVPSRVLNAVDLVLLRDGLLAVLVAGVFHAHPQLLPAAAALAGAQLLPALLGRVNSAYMAVWYLDVRILSAQPPNVRWAIWERWARDALLAPRRPDDNLLRVMVVRAQESVNSEQRLQLPLGVDLTSDSQQLLALVDEALRFLEGWLLLQEYPPGRWEAITERVTSIQAVAGTAKAQLAISRGQYEEASAHLARTADLNRRRGMRNFVAFGELYWMSDRDPGDALRIAQDESLSRVIRRVAMFGAAYEAGQAEDLELAAELYQRAEAIRPGRRDRAAVLAEVRRDLGRRYPWWMLRGSIAPMRMVERNLAGMTREAITGVPFLVDWGDLNELQNGVSSGRHALRIGQYARAVQVLSEVADEAERRGYPFIAFNACHWLARAQAGNGDPAAAYQSVRRAVDSYGLYRAALLHPGGEEDLGGLTLVHAYAITLLTEHPQIAERPWTTAFEVAEQARARGMLEKLGAAMPPPAGSDALVDREQAAVQAYAQALDALEAAEGDQRIARLDMVRSWRAELAACWTAMIEAGGATAEYAQLRGAIPTSYDHARRLLAAMGGTPATVFDYHVTDDADMVVFVIRADLPEPAVVRITHEHAAIYRALRRADWSGELRELDEVMRPFLAPVLEWSAPGDVVCFAPFGSMHAIPLHAMTVGGTTLIDRNPVCYVPSLTVLQHCAAKRVGRRERALVMADSRDDQPLPHARIQAAQIGALFPVGRGVTRLGAEATMAALQDGLADVDLLHLACHGEFAPDDPARSRILLAAADQLTVAELMRMRMRADLVTFSACESAVSQHELGEELTGLAQAAMYAGTPSVLATLWSVDQIATSVLMSSFYRRLLSGVSKVTALREAQQETRDMAGEALIAYCEEAMPHASESGQWLLRHDIADARFRCRDFAGALAIYQELTEVPDPPGGVERLRLAQTRCRRALNRPLAVDYAVRPFAHPYYWAPFVLIGDWR
jgi:CHAT domain-containing protein